MIDHYDQVISWTDWALHSVQTWDNTTAPASTWAGPARQILADAATTPNAPERSAKNVSTKRRTNPSGGHGELPHTSRP